MVAKTGFCFECGGQYLWTRNAYNHKPGCSRGHPAYYPDKDQEADQSRAASDYGVRVFTDGACIHHGHYPALECPGCEDEAEHRIQGADL